MEHIESCVPPGFRFHPTEEELVGYYLKRKINSQKIDLDVIVDIDLYRMEPWDIQEKCGLGYDEQNEWYFFSHKDRKYPTGTRTNRATAAGFWKATGRDKAVLSKERIIGMRKTLVYYKGRAPNGRKSDWIMHEYRLQTTEHAPPQEEGWVVCRAFKKPSPSHKQGYGAWNHHNNYYYMRNNSNHGNFVGSPSVNTDVPSPTDSKNHSANTYQQHPKVEQYFNNFEQEFISNSINMMENQLLVDLPRLDSPSLSTSLATTKEAYDQKGATANNEIFDHDSGSNKWEVLDNLLSSHMPEATSSFSNPQSLQLVPHDYELEVQHQLGSYLGCFANL